MQQKWPIGRTLFGAFLTSDVITNYTTKNCDAMKLSFSFIPFDTAFLMNSNSNVSNRKCFFIEIYSKRQLCVKIHLFEIHNRLCL